MLLNSRFNNYSLRFPPNWFYPDIVQRYDPFFRRLPVPFTNLTDFMSYTIQSVSWPSIATETVEQHKNGIIPVFKGGYQAGYYMGKELTITFRTVEGFLNYFVMQDMFEEYWSLNNPDEEIFLQDLTMQMLDYYGYQFLQISYINCVFAGLSELELSYASNVPEFRTFSATFRCAELKLSRPLD